MKNTLLAISIVFIILGIGIAPSAKASPAAPTFFEGISEWVGDVFTFGNVAKAERDIKKADAILQDLSANEPKDDSQDEFFKNGLANYQKRIENANLHLEEAKQKGNDTTAIGNTIKEITERHIPILEAGEKQLGSKAESVGLPRALEVVKETNGRAREVIGQALERKAGMEQNKTLPKGLPGWWEEIESWSIDPQSGNLKKDIKTLPFLREFTDKYFCTQYSAKSACTNNIAYSISGNKILLEGSSNFYEWRIIDEKLELVSKDSKGRTFGKSLSKKIEPPTSAGKVIAPVATRPGLAEAPKANIKLLKAGTHGLCLKHDGGDSIPITNIYIKLNGKSVSMGSFQQFPKFGSDFIFDAGEFFVLAVTPSEIDPLAILHVGNTVEIINTQGSPLLGPTRIDSIEPEDKNAPMLIGGLTSCP